MLEDPQLLAKTLRALCGPSLKLQPTVQLSILDLVFIEARSEKIAQGKRLTQKAILQHTGLGTQEAREFKAGWGPLAVIVGHAAAKLEIGTHCAIRAVQKFAGIRNLYHQEQRKLQLRAEKAALRQRRQAEVDELYQSRIQLCIPMVIHHYVHDRKGYQSIEAVETAADTVYDFIDRHQSRLSDVGLSWSDIHDATFQRLFHINRDNTEDSGAFLYVAAFQDTYRADINNNSVDNIVYHALLTSEGGAESIFALTPHQYRERADVLAAVGYENSIWVKFVLSLPSPQWMTYQVQLRKLAIIEKIVDPLWNRFQRSTMGIHLFDKLPVSLPALHSHLEALQIRCTQLRDAVFDVCSRAVGLTHSEMYIFGTAVARNVVRDQGLLSPYLLVAFHSQCSQYVRKRVLHKDLQDTSNKRVKC